ncbi:MAG: YgiT-type zinc finger protein [Nitrospinae bacterium]|nr:YgiT-type zinc finger protein [Nitrospinota bacterium]
MFRCHVCGSTQAKEVFENEVFQIDGKPVLVEHVPAMKCAHCGEETFSRETMERIRKMVHGEATPEKSVSMGVFTFA